MEGTLWLAWVLSVQGPHLLGFVVVVVTPALNGGWLITIDKCTSLSLSLEE